MRHGSYLTHESRVVVLGLPRYGKTRLIRDVLTADSERVLFHDLLGHDYSAPGRIRLSIDELEAHSYLLEREHVRIVVVCSNPADPDTIVDEVSRIYQLVYPAPGKIVVVFDEVGRHGRRTDKLLNGFFSTGSHYGIATILASQKATDIPLGARTTASDCYCFGQHHPKELQVLFDCYGDVFAARAASAKRGEPALHWSEATRDQWWSEVARKRFAVGG